MLGLTNKNEEPTPVSPTPEVKSVGEIYTMPQTNASMSGSPVKPGQPKNLLGLWISLGAAVIVGSGLAAYFIYFNSPDPITPDPTPIVNDTNTNTNTEPEPDPTPIVTSTPAERDRQRYLDVKNLQIALQLYFDDRGLYPVAISELQLGRVGASTLSASGFSDYPQAPIYISQLPADPTLGQDVYYRYLSPTGTTYQIFFNLEEGISNLTAGAHYVGPTGFDGVEPTTPQTPSETENDELAPPTPSADADQDGLTDQEEVIYGTAVDNSDTDADSYTDGSEVLSGYNPAVGSGAKLYEAEFFTKYSNEALGFSFYYPTTWTTQSLDAGDADVIFTSPTNEFMQVVVQENPDNLTPVEWYANNSPEVLPANVPVLNLGSIVAARSLNGLHIYFTVGTKLVSLSYNLATHITADYLTTWQAIYQSLSLVESLPN